MKKIFSIIISFMLVMCCTAFATSGVQTVDRQYNDIKVSVYGQTLDLNGVNEPFVIDGTTYLPVRAIAEALGLNVAWDDVTKTVKLTKPYATPTDILLYDKGDIQIYYIGISKQEYFDWQNIHFKIVNNSSEKIGVQLRDESVNGIMCDFTISSEVESGKMAMTKAICSEFDDLGITTMEKMEFKFHIFNDSWETIADSDVIHIVW